jgi:hypothetical protein
MFFELIEGAKHIVYKGGNFSRFVFTVKLLHVKYFYRNNNVAFNVILP